MEGGGGVEWKREELHLHLPRPIFLFPFFSWLLLSSLGLDVDEKTLSSMENTGKGSPDLRGWAESIRSLIPSCSTTVPYQVPCQRPRMQSRAGHSQSGGKADQPMGSNYGVWMGATPGSIGLGVGGARPHLEWCRWATEHSLWDARRQQGKDSRGNSV